MRLLAIAAVLTLSPLTITPALAQGLPALVADGTILDVSATGKTTRVPDIATISAGVVTQASTGTQALADNARQMAKVLAALKVAGVQPRDVTTSSVSLQPQYRYANGEAPAITGYQASNTVSIRFREIAKAGKILDVLASEGANQINGPNLSIDRVDAAMDEARTDAVAKARARAELYAKAAGLSVARILAISEEGGARPPVITADGVRFAAEPAPPPSTQIAPGEADVLVTISVRFLLK
jgi:uncharacterized protein YggE